MKYKLIIVSFLTLILLVSCANNKTSNDKKTQELIKDVKVSFKGVENVMSGRGHLFDYKIESNGLKCDLPLMDKLVNGEKLNLICHDPIDDNNKTEKEIEINNLLVPITDGYKHNLNLHSFVYNNNLEFFPDAVAILKEMHLVKFGGYVINLEKPKGEINNHIFHNKYEWLKERKNNNLNLYTDNVFILIYESLSDDEDFLNKHTAGKKYIMNIYNNIFKKPGSNYSKDSNDYQLVDLDFNNLSYTYIKGHPKPAISLFANDINTLKENI